MTRPHEPAKLCVAIATLQVVDTVNQVRADCELEQVGLADDDSRVLGKVAALDVIGLLTGTSVCEQRRGGRIAYWAIDELERLGN